MSKEHAKISVDDKQKVIVRCEIIPAVQRLLQLIRVTLRCLPDYFMLQEHFTWTLEGVVTYSGKIWRIWFGERCGACLISFERNFIHRNQRMYFSAFGLTIEGWMRFLGLFFNFVSGNSEPLWWKPSLDWLRNINFDDWRFSHASLSSRSKYQSSRRCTAVVALGWLKSITQMLLIRTVHDHHIIF